MPKGKPGCFVCGAPVEFKLNVWLRRYVEGEFIAGNKYERRQTTVVATTRSLCGACAEAKVAQAFAIVARRWSRAHGCGVCGQRATMRVQVWLTTDGPNAQSVSSLSTSYCDEHAEDVYLRAAAPLSPQTVKTVDLSSRPTMEAARAAQRRLLHG